MSRKGYLFVFFLTLEFSDGVLAGICGDGETLHDFRRRGRSLKDAVVLLRVGRLLAGASGGDGRLRGDGEQPRLKSFLGFPLGPTRI